LNQRFELAKGARRKERIKGVAAHSVLLVNHSAEYGIEVRESVRPSRWFISLTLRACEENIVEVRVIDVKLMRAYSNYGTV
jgi:hypothetical protein